MTVRAATQRPSYFATATIRAVEQWYGMLALLLPEHQL
jgi:hypothetical protein